jgi:AcrR family transcriptional regulator
MPRKLATSPPASRRRRSADEARSAILDAAERRLAESGPAAIRLQEVAADVGVSHPTVLHHFGSREALVEAVVRRALDSLQAKLLAAVNAAPASADEVSSLLDAVFDALVVGGHGRTFLWLALSGYAPSEDLHIRPLAEAVHATRRERRSGKKRMPSFEDTYFTVLLPALALLSLSAVEPAGTKEESDRDPIGPRSFRRWLARLLHEHLERE